MKSTFDDRAVVAQALTAAPADRIAATVVILSRIMFVVVATAVAVAITLG